MTFFDLPQRPIAIRGAPALAPLFYRDVRMMLGLFAAPLDAVRAVLPSARLRPLRPFTGHGVVAVACFEYRDTDIGPYNEVAVAVAARLDRGPTGPLACLRSVLSRRYRCFVADLPVNTEIALHGGLDWFHYPKTLADIRFEEDRDHRTCTVRDPETGEPIYTFRGRKLATRPVGPHEGRRETTEITSWPVDGEKLLRATMLLHEDRRARSLRQDAMTLHCSSHARARALRDLRPGRLLAYTWAPDARAILLEPGLAPA